RYIDLGTDNVKFAAGMEKLLVVLDSDLLQRFDLATGERERSESLPVLKRARAVAMGSASAGPLFLGASERESGPLNVFLDIQTFKEIPTQMEGAERFIVDDGSQIRASADGRIIGMWRPNLSPQGIQTLVLNGNKAKSYYEHDSAGHVVPGP